MIIFCIVSIPHTLSSSAYNRSSVVEAMEGRLPLSFVLVSSVGNVLEGVEPFGSKKRLLLLLSTMGLGRRVGGREERRGLQEESVVGAIEGSEVIDVGNVASVGCCCCWARVMSRSRY